MLFTPEYKTYIPSAAEQTLEADEHLMADGGAPMHSLYHLPALKSGIPVMEDCGNDDRNIGPYPDLPADHFIRLRPRTSQVMECTDGIAEDDQLSRRRFGETVPYDWDLSNAEYMDMTREVPFKYNLVVCSVVLGVAIAVAMAQPWVDDESEWGKWWKENSPYSNAITVDFWDKCVPKQENRIDWNNLTPYKAPL